MAGKRYKNDEKDKKKKKIKKEDNLKLNQENTKNNEIKKSTKNKEQAEKTKELKAEKFEKTTEKNKNQENESLNKNTKGRYQNKYALKYEDYTKPKNKVARVISIILIIIVVIIVGIVCAGFGYLQQKYSKLNYQEIDKNAVGISDTTKDAMKDFTNIAILGLDSRYDTYSTDYRTDCIMIASINNKTNEVTLWSIYRDTYVQMELSGKTFLNKINQAYYDGVQNTLKTINTNLDLNITQYAMADFNAVRDLVDAVGGIELKITSEELKYINNYIDDVSKVTDGKTKHLTTPGTQTVDGIQAVSYCRIRYDGKDYKRTERMRTVLEKVVSKIKSLSLTEINELLNEMFPKIQTNITQSEITGLISKALSLSIKDSFGWPYKTEGVTLNNDFYGPADTLETNVEQLHKEVFGQTNYVVPDSIKEISDKSIEETGVGKETKAAQE